MWSSGSSGSWSRQAMLLPSLNGGAGLEGLSPQLGGAPGRGALLWRAAVTGGVSPCPRVLPQGTAVLQCGVTVRVTPVSREEGGDSDGGHGGSAGRGQREQGLCERVSVCVPRYVHECTRVCACEQD